MPSSIRRWSPNLLPRLPSSDGITDSTAAQNSSEITPIRVTGQSSLVNTFPFGRHALVDRQLRQPRPAGRADGFADHLRGRCQRRRQIALRGLEVIAVDVHGPRVTVAECLHKNVFAGILQAPRPFEPEVALFGSGRLSEWSDKLRPAVGPLRFGLKLHDDEYHGGPLPSPPR